jgi:hypothetical protein
MFPVDVKVPLCKCVCERESVCERERERECVCVWCSAALMFPLDDIYVYIECEVM